MPATDLTDVGRIHDVCMIQFDSIALTPQADNPLGRIVVRPDIYHLAEQEHILGVPGSEVEDRQYQLNVLGLCVNTGTWKELDRCLGQNVNSQLSSLTLRTMNENPALEWNNLMCGVESIMPHMTLLPVVQRVDLCVVAAPAILYKDVLVCGVSFEVNAFTNIEVSVSMNQVLLASALFTELLMLLEPLIADSFYHSNYTLLPTASLPNQTSDEIEIFVTDYNKFADSGIDCADISSMSGEKLSVNQIKDGTTISSINTPKSSGYHADVSSREKREHPVTLYDTRHPKTRENPRVVPVHKVASKESTTNMKRYPKNTPDKPELVPIEILFTASTISGVLYQVLGTTESNLHELTSLWRQRVKQRITSNPSIFTDESGPYFSSNETSTDDVSADDEVLTQGKNVQPLLYIFVSQPHSYISRLSQSRKIQISCFDISIRTCIDKSFHCHNTPKLENFPTILLETKSGDPHQETGIPPSFLTVIWSKGIGKPAKLEIDLGRPTKCHLSVARLNYLEGIVRKIFDIYSDSDNILQSAELTFQRKDMHRDVAGSRIDEEKEMFFLHYEVSRDSIERPSFIEKNPNVTIPDGTLSTTHISSLDLQSDYKNIGDGDQTQSMVQLQHLLWQVSEMSVKTQQIVLSMETTEGFKVLLSLLDLTCGVSYQSRQVDRVTGNVAVNSLTITTYWKNYPRLLLNPWTFAVNVCLAWEPWCKNEATPQIQVTADSDCILIDVGPEHLRCLHYVWQEYKHLIECFSLNNSTQHNDTRSKVSDSLPDQEQHYRDDLRAGAFQYLDSTNTSRDELPLPYQVVFWGSPPTMAWRYPQPRALTRVDVFPVPFKLASVDHFARGQRDQVVCSLQYWSECRSSYQHYARFQLSESEMCRLNLPHPPHRVVACTWRVQLFVRSPDNECDDTNGNSHSLNNIHMSPRALAACMRIDSFFSPHLVPHLQVAVNFSSLQVGLYNHLCISTTSRELPPSLGEYAMDNLLPDSQCFSTLELNKASLFFCLWPTGVNMLELGSIIQCSVIDYAYLTQQYVVEPCQVQLQLSVGEKAELSCVTKALTIKLGPGVGHTLSVSTQLWLQALESFSTTAEKQKQVYQVIVSRYVICNNTTRPLRFGQAGTDEDILLASKHCHLYSWRTHKVKQLLRVGVEEGSWVWCQPFMIDKDGTEWCPLKECGSKDLNLLIQVVSLSTTQKQIIIAGQLLITNLLVQNLECQVVPIEDESSRLNEGQSLIALGNSTPASILLDNKCKMGLRIRFHRREATWSSNIPLRENTKHGKPWLVKLPLLDSVQFLRVWCRVICQKLGTHGIKILAMLCPVYMIRSYLPIPAKALIDTPGLNVHLESTVNGKGEEQQLYCPGTIDHSHQLTFQLENGIPPSNPYVPLSYSMLDQHTLKSSSDEDIDIDHVLRSLNDNKSKTWPFLGDVYESVDWISAEQPETHVQVKYVAKDPFCSTLLVDLQPWALFANVLGTSENDGRIIPETAHIEWWCTIQPQSSAYYTMPISSERFPYFLSPNNSSPLVLALNINENNDKHPLWSPGVNIMEIQEQFVPLPGHGDVKVKVEMRCHTTCVIVETVSHVEISARDIRSRLSFRYADTSNNSVEAAINPLVQQVSHLEPDHQLTPSSSEVHVELQQASKSSTYKLGNTLALHYLYGAIFGVGWVVGSMELLGNPGGLARTLGTGLRDFVYLPYQGILQGPWGFFVGVTHGSASLMKHITAGTLSSVTNFAASVARNLDRLTLDQEHFHRTEEVRRQRPQGVAQGLLQGLTGLGISLLGAVGGIAHHPLQSMMSEGASPRSLVTGVGRGLVGVITKPLSGAAELVALTGQGLLHGTGWTTLPNVRQEPVIEHTFCGTNSQLKYNWKLVAGLASGRHTLLHVTEATCISPSGIYEPVALVLTTQALFLINTEEDTTQRVLSLSELSGLDHPTDPTLLCFQFQMPPMPMEMDPTSHARVVEFVRRSSGMVNFGNDSNSDAESSQSGSPLLNDVMSFDTPLTFYVNPQLRNYFLSVLALAKRQSQGRGFAVL
uniref:Vacuolar protein sorting-associated protein 13 DH-like domain-containing protein n=1 Tax=Timema shepardi TaxID=629360 RepID=A0A7R9G4A5_TIMSH|nr:unnamed protein product [Timema shepardi]